MEWYGSLPIQRLDLGKIIILCYNIYYTLVILKQTYEYPSLVIVPSYSKALRLGASGVGTMRTSGTAAHTALLVAIIVPATAAAVYRLLGGWSWLRELDRGDEGSLVSQTARLSERERRDRFIRERVEQQRQARRADGGERESYTGTAVAN